MSSHTRRTLFAVLGAVCASAFFAACAADSGPTTPTTSSLVSTPNLAATCPLTILPGDGSQIDLANDVTILDFKQQVLGGSQRPLTFDATNAGPNRVQVTSLDYDTTNYRVDAPQVIGVGTSVFSVLFAPKTTGTFNSNLTFGTDQPGAGPCRVELRGVAVDETLPPQVSGPYLYAPTITVTTVAGDGSVHSCTSVRQESGTLTLNLLAGPNDTVTGTARLDGIVEQTGGTCGPFARTNENVSSNNVSGTSRNIMFKIVSQFSTGLSSGSNTWTFSGQLSLGVVSGFLTYTQTFTHNAGNGGGGGSVPATFVSLHAPSSSQSRRY